jgi:hypothetical protein
VLFSDLVCLSVFLLYAGLRKEKHYRDALIIFNLLCAKQINFFFLKLDTNHSIIFRNQITEIDSFVAYVHAVHSIFGIKCFYRFINTNLICRSR